MDLLGLDGEIFRKIFYSDDFGPYQKLIAESMLVRSKSETVAIKQNNGCQCLACCF